MKKLAALLLALSLLLSLAACGEKSNEPEPGDDPLAVLNTVWSSYSHEDEFSAVGGDAGTQGEPGAYSLTDASALDAALGFPAASVGKLESAASLTHMLNANTFTCGAYGAKDARDVTELTMAIKDNIMQRQWLCGFPDKLVVMTVGNVVVAFFGETQLVDVFKANLIAAYTSAVLVSEDPIA